MLRDLLDVLVEGARGAVRLQVEGRSSARGPRPGWLDVAAEFDVLPLEEGSTVVPIMASPLSETAPEWFAQASIVASISRRSGLGLFEESLGAALEGDEESESFDQALLERFKELAHIVDDEIDTIEITTDEPGSSIEGASLRIGPERFATIDRLIQKTPPSQRTRLAGKLNMIRHHDRMFALQLESGETVKGVAESLAVDDLSAHWGEDVIVHGRASFRPSGAVLRVEADAIEEAKGSTALWSCMPKPVFHNLPEGDLREKQGPRSGLNAIYGKWPGGETDEEIAEALAEIS